jgi:hypothetical protein
VRLAAAARHFDNTSCLDGYGGSQSFQGQFALYDGSRRDAEVTARQHLSVSPNVVVPPRKVVLVGGVRHILGHGTPDYFRGKKIRVGYATHEATHLAQVRSLEAVSLKQEGVSAWAGKSWVKNLAYTEQTSDLPRQEHIHFSKTEPVAKGSLISLGTQHFLVREVEDSVAGFRVALADEMPGVVVQDVTFSPSTFDPVTETYTGSSTPARVVQVRWQSLFCYGHRDAPDFGPEDVQLAVAKSVVTPKPGMIVQTASGRRYVESVMSYQGVWLCRAVLHA